MNFYNKKDLQNIIDLLAEANNKNPIKIPIGHNESIIPKKYKRVTGFLDNKIFNVHHSETSLMRYIKSLERKDLSLTQSMISLGSVILATSFSGSGDVKLDEFIN